MPADPIAFTSPAVIDFLAPFFVRETIFISICLEPALNWIHSYLCDMNTWKTNYYPEIQFNSLLNNKITKPASPNHWLVPTKLNNKH